MIDYKNKKRNCTECKFIFPFDEFGWDYRRNIPRSKCRKCTSEKYYNSASYRKKYRERKNK